MTSPKEYSAHDSPQAPCPAPQQPHPLRCETCANIECEYYSIRDNMSAGHDHQTGWRASPGVITFAVGCASHSAASQQRIEQVIKELESTITTTDELYSKRFDSDAYNSLRDRVKKAIALLQAGRK